jgi:hypothetical protein
MLSLLRYENLDLKFCQITCYEDSGSFEHTNLLVQKWL